MLFNENMSSEEAERIFLEYAAAHHGENFDDIKREYMEILEIIIPRELRETRGRMTE